MFLTLDIAIRVRTVSVVINKLDLLPTSTPAPQWSVLSSSPSDHTSDDERNEQGAARRSQGDDRNEQVLLLGLEVCEAICVGVASVREGVPDVRSLDTGSGEERRTVGIDRTLGIIALRSDAVDEEVGDDVLGASGLLGETRMTKAVLFDEDGAIAQISSNHKGVLEGSCRVSLVSDDDDWVFQRVVPRAGEPFDSTRGPSVAVMGGLGELNAN